ncbi:MAG: exodeoxyribonuclease VII large subunit [Candidatus Methanomethylophilaceae archaeon]|nr:exodeoxyribonuclease VII large subunit [Candidatus Methanomethylophilaceae archaeon]
MRGWPSQGRRGKGLNIISVKELNEKAKTLLAASPDLNDVWVQGEISNLTKHSSGHYYFTLKDQDSEIRCTLFRFTRSRLAFEPELNMKVLALGSMEVFIPKGSYQFNIQDMRRSGIGDLYLAYEALKAKLGNEGLFDQSRKRKLPRYPLRIGVVTSPTGAAIRDILQVTGRRFPADIVIAPALVQGDGAAASIVHAIESLNKLDVDVMIVGRGGGSIEDLWAFNEEAVARAIHASRVPVVSAVGHETDFTIADLVADVRAPTPSAAAELLLPDRSQEMRHLQQVTGRAEKAPRGSLDRMCSRYRLAEAQLSPRKALMDLRHRNQLLDEASTSMDNLMLRRLERQRARLQSLGSSLVALSPLQVLSRGYCVLQSAQGKALVSIEQLSLGDKVTALLRDGKVTAVVEEKEAKR